MNKPIIVILGAGAVGLSLAGKFSAVSSVYIACRPRHARVIRDRGLTMSGAWGDQIISDITCIDGTDDAPHHPDYIIITAKGTDTETICQEYVDLLKDNVVVTFQNGIGNEDIIAGYAGATIGGTIITNFSHEADGKVRVKSSSGPMTAGLWSGGNDEILDNLITLISDAGIQIRKSADIRAAKWGKSLLNIAVNPLCALLSAPVGCMGKPDLRHLISGLITETYAVMDARDIRVDWPDPEAYLHHLFTVQIPDFAHVYPSMYYDIREGRKTEIELLNGYVAREGDRLSIPTPYNHCIVDLIRFRQTYPQPL